MLTILIMATAAYMLIMGCILDTHNMRSAIVFKAIPITLAILLAMSQAKVIF